MMLCWNALLLSVEFSSHKTRICSPQFIGMNIDTNGNLDLSLQGLTGAKNFTIYASSNLADWSVLSILSAVTGSNQFTVPLTNAATFYRASQP